MSSIAFWIASLFQSGTPQPRPDLAPEEVIRIVVTALQHHDSPSPNAGIFTVYQFASPSNRAITGPYGHFLRLVKSPDFAPMLRDQPAEFSALDRRGDEARQILTVHQDAGSVTQFQIVVSREREGPFRDCWMVRAVARLSP